MTTGNDLMDKLEEKLDTEISLESIERSLESIERSLESIVRIYGVAKVLDVLIDLSLGRIYDLSHDETLENKIRADIWHNIVTHLIAARNTPP